MKPNYDLLSGIYPQNYLEMLLRFNFGVDMVKEIGLSCPFD